MVMMLVVVMVTVFVVVMMLVVFAPIRRQRQLTFQVGGHQRRHRRIGKARPHRDSVVPEMGQRPATNAARDDDLHAQLPQPTRKQTGLVFGGGHDFGAERLLLVGVHFDQRELAAAAEVAVQAAVFMRNGDFHS